MLLPRKITWGIIGACFLAFFWVSGARAQCYIDTPLNNFVSVDSYKQPGGTGSYGVIWTATSSFQTDAVAFKICDWTNSSSDWNAYVRFGSYTGGVWTYIATSSLENDDVFQNAANATACYTAALGVYFEFDNWQTIANGGTYFFKVYSTASPADNFLLTDILDNDFNGLENLTIQTTISPWFSIQYDNCAYDEDVEVIENPDYDPDSVVEVWSEDFQMSTKICWFGTDCEWSFNYSKDYDGGVAYLIYDEDPRSRTETLASTTLELVPIRTDSFIVPEPAVAGTYFYCVFLETASTSELYLSCEHQINWYEENTDITNNASSTDLRIFWGLFDKLTNIFPVSIAKQIWSIFAAAKDATTTPAILYLQDVMPDEADTILGVTNPELLSYDLLKDNLTIWDTVILRFMNYCVYLIGFFICIFLVFPKLRSIDLGGHHKQAAPEDVSHIETVNLRKPARGLTIDLRKNRY